MLRFCTRDGSPTSSAQYDATMYSSQLLTPAPAPPGTPRRDWLWRFFPWHQDSANYRSVQFVLSVNQVAAGVANFQDEDWQGSFLVEALVANRNRKRSFQLALAVGGFVTMPPQVPGEHPNLVVIEGHAVLRFAEQNQVFGNFLVAVPNFVEYEECLDAPPFGVLGDIKRNIQVHHAGQNPAGVALGVANEPPVFHHGLRGFFIRLRTGRRRGLFLGSRTLQYKKLGALI